MSPPQRFPVPPALALYRVMAYLVGVVLLVLVFIGVPLNHLAHRPAVVATVGPAHGVLYVVYVVVALNLGVRYRWSLGRIALVLVAGTVPFLSFVMERRVTRRLRQDASQAVVQDAV